MFRFTCFITFYMLNLYFIFQLVKICIYSAFLLRICFMERPGNQVLSARQSLIIGWLLPSNILFSHGLSKYSAYRIGQGLPAAFGGSLAG